MTSRQGADKVFVTVDFCRRTAGQYLRSTDRTRRLVDAGPPPIRLGFGSMADANPEELRAVVLDTLIRLKTRAVVVGGSGGALHGFGNAENICEVCSSITTGSFATFPPSFIRAAPALPPSTSPPAFLKSSFRTVLTTTSRRGGCENLVSRRRASKDIG
jgi:hypothetical protein